MLLFGHMRIYRWHKPIAPWHIIRRCLQFVEIRQSAYKIIQPHKWHTHNSCLSGHRLTITDIERCKRHHVVHIERTDANAVGFQRWLQGTLARDINAAVRLQHLYHPLRHFRTYAMYAHIMMSREFHEPNHEIRALGINAVFGHHLLIGLKLMRMQIAEFMIRRIADFLLIPLTCARAVRLYQSGKERVKQLCEKGRCLRIIFIANERWNAQ